MVRLSPRLWLLLAALAAISCEHEIDMRMDDVHPTLCANAYILADTTYNTLHLSLTSTAEPEPVRAASVVISVGGTERERCEELDGVAGTYLLRTRFEAGDHVHIDITTADGLHHATVDEVVPQPVPNGIDVSTHFFPTKRLLYDSGRIDEAQGVSELRISLPDRSQSADYYRLSAVASVEDLCVVSYNWGEQRADTNVYAYFMPASLVYNEDPIVMEGSPITPSDTDFPSVGNIPNNYGVFSDLLFADQTASITAYWPLPWFILRELTDVSDPYDDDDEDGSSSQVNNYYSLTLLLRLECVTASEYYYLRALNTRESDSFQDNSDLTGPIRLPSNVEGGTGTVAFSTFCTIPIRLVDNNKVIGM